MIKSITLNNVACYKHSTTLNTDKYVNLIYGLNGSGKSTLSKYLKNLDDDEYSSCSIEGLDENQEILVYNTEFVRENFYESAQQKGIFTLSKENREVENAIKAEQNIHSPVRRAKQNGTGSEEEPVIYSKEEVASLINSYKTKYLITEETDDGKTIYKLNEEAIKQDFPNADIKTIDDLIEAASAKDKSWVDNFFKEAQSFLPKSFVLRIVQKYYGNAYIDGNNSQIKAIIGSINEVLNEKDENGVSLYEKLKKADNNAKATIREVLNQYNVENELHLYGEYFKNDIRTLFNNAYAEATKVYEYTEEIEQFFNSVKGKTFESIDEFKAECKDLVNCFNIEQVYAQGNTKYYKVVLKGTDKGISVTVVPNNAASNVNKQGVDSSTATLQKIEQLFKDVKNETYSSLDEFKAACGNLVSQLNIEPVYSNSDYTYYKVTVNGLASMETTIKVEKNHNVSDTTNNNTINIDELFGGLDSIDADYFIQNYKSWQNSDVPVLQTMYKLINKSFEDLGINSARKNQHGGGYCYNLPNLFNALIKIINDTIGITNTNPPTLTKEAIDTLNNIGGLMIIKNIMNNSAFENEYYFGSIDGVIGAFAQGDRPNWNGSCVFFANIISANRVGLLDNIIMEELQENGEIAYRVTLKNMDWSTLVTKDEIKIGVRDGYMFGDADALILETAFIKMGREYGFSFDNLPGLLSDNYINIETIFDFYDIQTAFDMICDDFNNGNIILTYGGAGHRCSIVGIDRDNKTVTIVNPYESDKLKSYTWDEFANMRVNVSGFQTFDSFDYENFIFGNNATGDDIYLRITRLTDEYNQGVLYNSVNDFVYYSEEKLNALKDKIMKEVILRYQNGNINNITKIENFMVNDSIRNEAYHEFDYNGHKYWFLVDNYSGYTYYKSDEILEYTTNPDIINEYFDITAAIDGVPLTYKLKDGVTLENFINEVNNRQNEQMINDLFSPFENGKIDENTLISNLYSQRNKLNNEQKKLASNKVIKLCILGKLEVSNIEFLLTEFGFLNRNDDIVLEYTNRINYHKFVFDSKEYKIFSNSSIIDANNERHTCDEVLKYTQDKNLINKYFELAASIDGKPVMYILKNGVTFEDFLAEVKP